MWGGGIIIPNSIIQNPYLIRRVFDVYTSVLFSFGAGDTWVMAKG